jgi:large subunit ribosomal protein L25
MAIYKLDAELREDVGKGASRRLRREGKIPAIIYGAGRDPRSIALLHHKVAKLLEDDSFFSSIIELKAAGGNRQKVILRDMQRHPAKPIIMHMDFQRVRDDEELHISVPIHFVNEEISPAGKTTGVVVSHQKNEVEIVCLPENLPEFIELDLSTMEVGQSLHLSDLPLPEGVKLAAFTHGDDEMHDEVVVSAGHVRGGAKAAESEETTEEGGEEGEAAEE